MQQIYGYYRLGQSYPRRKLRETYPIRQRPLNVADTNHVVVSKLGINYEARLGTGGSSLISAKESLIYDTTSIYQGGIKFLLNKNIAGGFIIRPPRRGKSGIRPNRFILNREHLLYGDLYFAGLGNMAGGKYYRDSSTYHNDGLYTTVPQWGVFAGRKMFMFDNAHHILLQKNFATIVTTPVYWFSCWVYLNSTGITQNIFQTGSNIAYPLGVTYAQTNRLKIWSNTSNEWYSPVGVIPLQTWTHLCIQRINGNFTRVYVNGINQVMTSQSQAWNLDTNGHLGYTSCANLGTQYLDGNIADPLLVNGTIVASNITILADPTNVMLTFNNKPLILDTSPRIFGTAGIIVQNVLKQTQEYETKAPVTGTGIVIRKRMGGITNMPFRRKIIERPNRFTLNRGHLLRSHKLVFANLGQMIGDDTNYEDNSFYQYNGILTGYTTPTWSKAIGRNALIFNGTNNRVLVPTKYPNGTTSPWSGPWGKVLTLSCWCYPKPFVAAYSQIIGYYQWFSNYGYGIVLDNTGIVRGGCDNTTGGAFYTNLTAQLLFNQWQHIVFTISGVTGTITGKLYVNGILQSTYTGAAALTTGGLVGLAIGNVHRYGTLADSNYFKGMIADPMLFNYPLPQTIISLLADPSNVMLNIGNKPLILPPPRQSFPSAGSQTFGTAINYEAQQPASSPTIQNNEIINYETRSTATSTPIKANELVAYETLQKQFNQEISNYQSSQQLLCANPINYNSTSIKYIKNTENYENRVITLVKSPADYNSSQSLYNKPMLDYEVIRPIVPKETLDYMSVASVGGGSTVQKVAGGFTYIRQRRKIQERPERFILNRQHPLYGRTLYAGFGNSPGGLNIRDSSVNRLDSQFRSNVATKHWVRTLNRNALKFVAANIEYIKSFIFYP